MERWRNRHRPSFHNLSTGILDALGRNGDFFSSERRAFNLRQQRQNGHATVAADDVDADCRRSAPWLRPRVSPRITSRVVTPNRRRLSQTPAFFSTSAAMATVVLTGLVMMPISAFGREAAHFSTRFLTIPALMLNRSERSMPGLRATPAEIQHDIGADQSRARIFTAETFYFHVSQDMAQVRRHARGDRCDVIQAQFGTGGKAIFQQQSGGLADATGGRERQLSRRSTPCLSVGLRLFLVGLTLNSYCAPHLKGSS